MVANQIRRAAFSLVLLGMLASVSACQNGSLSLGNRTDFKPPDDPCWPIIESCHDSYYLCPAYCR